MKHTIPTVNWTTHLADAISASQDGDTILVTSEAMLELVQRAKRRMCPDKRLDIQLDTSAVSLNMQ